jgi:hypothetical protein
VAESALTSLLKSRVQRYESYRFKPVLVRRI